MLKEKYTKGLPKICIDFLTYYQDNLKKSEHTIIAYATDLREFVNYQFGDKYINEEYFGLVTLRDLDSFQATYSNKSTSAMARVTASVKAFYNYLDKYELIAKNPALHFKQPKVEKKLPKYLNEKESMKLLNSVDKTNCRQPERDFAILLLFLTTGIRVSELANINKDDIKDGFLIVTGKGNKQRQIPLTVECQDAIKEYLKAKKYYDGDALFTTERNNRVHPAPVSLMVKSYLTKIGKKDMSTHKLRHTAATTWHLNGTDILKIKELLGHTHINTTEIYTHINPESLVGVVNNTGLSGFKRQKAI